MNQAKKNLARPSVSQVEPIISVTREAKKGGSQSQTSLRKSVRLYLQISKPKRPSGVAQVIDHLPSKHKDLTSNSSTIKKQRLSL
jgi:hypothetical protein